MKITISNVVHSQVTRDGIELLSECLSYEQQIYKYNYATGKSTRMTVPMTLINSNGVFLSGLMPRVEEFLTGKGIPYTIENRTKKVTPTNKPEIKNKKLREDQTELVNAVLTNQRGVIVSPTGSGKTLIAGAIISCYKNMKSIFIVHTRTLLNQAASDFKEYGLKNITVVGEGAKNLSGDIVVATRQSLMTLDLNQLREMFDIVIIDECHHVSSKIVTYVDIMKKSLAPIRVGLTATYPSSEAAQLAIEGVLGPIIGEFEEGEAVEKGIIAKTKIVIRKTIFDQKIRDLTKYKNVYHDGIVVHYGYNRAVMKEAKHWVDKGLTVLVMFVELEQGELLEKIGRKEFKLDSCLINGATDGQDRERIRKDLNKKKIQCVLSSVIWKEGVNIPSLGVVINAAGGKSDIAVRQLKGRGGRVTEDKDTLVYVDFFNPSHPHLVNHFGHRVSLYCDLGWL